MSQIKKIFQWLFPCNFNEPLCKDNFFGCRCGKNLFKSKRVGTKLETLYDPFANVRSKLSSWLGERIGKPAERYPGEIVAPMGEEEKRSFDWLRKYGEQGVPEGRQLAMGELRKTMAGEYDPSTSPYYQAVKATAQKNLEETLGDIASEAAGRGMYHTGARRELQTTARTDVTQALNELLGGMAETERARRFQAVPLAQQIGAYEEALPLQKAAAFQQLGALPRAIQQAMNEAAYNEWLRSTQEYPLQIAQLVSPFVGQQPIFGQVGYRPSRFSRLTGGLFS